MADGLRIRAGTAHRYAQGSARCQRAGAFGICAWAVRRCTSAVALLFVWFVWGGGVGVQAAGPVDVYDFPDAETELRYRALVGELRCPKCLNVNLSGSDAPIAQDLRAAVYRLVVREGHSDREVRAFMQARYGDFVLYDPPVRPGTALLWLGPALFALVGLGLVAYRLRGQRAAVMSAGDRQRLQAILDEE